PRQIPCFASANPFCASRQESNPLPCRLPFAKLFRICLKRKQSRWSAQATPASRRLPTLINSKPCSWANKHPSQRAKHPQPPNCHLRGGDSQDVHFWRLNDNPKSAWDSSLVVANTSR